MDNKCAWPRCRQTDIAILYYNLPICERCLQRIGELGPVEAKVVLKLPPQTYFPAYKAYDPKDYARRTHDFKRDIREAVEAVDPEDPEEFTERFEALLLEKTK